MNLQFITRFIISMRYNLHTLMYNIIVSIVSFVINLIDIINDVIIM